MRRKRPPTVEIKRRSKPPRAAALDAALLSAASASGPQLIRLPTAPETLPAHRSQAKVVEKATPLNTILADTLRSAGLAPGDVRIAEPPKPAVSADRKLLGVASEASLASQAKIALLKEGKPRRSKAPASQKLPAPTPSPSKRKKSKSAVPSRTAHPSLPRRSMAEKEQAATAARERVQAFIIGIEAHPFHDLLTQWQKHVELIGYIQKTRQNRARLPFYQDLVDAVEREWQRRGSLRPEDTVYFDWPSTDARNGVGGLGEIGWVSEGVLRYLGYSVSKATGLTINSRQSLLRRIFHMMVPPFEKPSYIREWGEPETSARLRKMAESIASFVRLAKAQSRSDKSLSIEAWEADLAMLRNEFYIGKFGFGWPVT